MKIYLVSRLDDVDYDEYDSFVICAENRTNAVMIAEEKSNGFFKVEEVATNKECIILGSFNTG